MDFYKDQPEAVGQAAETRLRLWLGEWFLDTEEGTPYMQGVFGKHSQTEADNTIQQRVLGTQGLTDLTNYLSLVNPDTRGMSVTMDIDTIYGPTPVQVENYSNY